MTPPFRDNGAESRASISPSGLPGTRYESVPNQKTETGIALAEFRRWYTENSSKGQIRVTSPGMLDISPELSEEFMLGIFGSRYFMGIPQGLLPWFLFAPWIHIALRPGFTGISLVCDRFAAEGLSIEPFSLNFDSVQAGVVKSLANYHFIDVRAIVETSDSNTCAVGKLTLMTIEVIPVVGERDFPTVFAGKSAAAHAVRQHQRKTGKL